MFVVKVCLFGLRRAISRNWYSDGQRVLPSAVHLSNSCRISLASMLRAMVACTHSSSTLSSVFHGGVAGRIALAMRSNVCFASVVSTGRFSLASSLAVVAPRCKCWGDSSNAVKGCQIWSSSRGFTFSTYPQQRSISRHVHDDVADILGYLWHYCVS